MSDRKKKKAEKAAKSLKRLQRRQQERGEALAAPFGEQIRVVRDVPGQVKMSEVLLDLVDSYFRDARDLREMHHSIALGIVAWNTTLRPPDERSAAIDDYLRGLPPMPEEVRQAFLEILHVLLQRKLELDPDLRRHILNYDLQTTPHGPHLNVVSTFPE